MLKLVTGELPVFSLYLQPSIAAHAAALRGPDKTGSGWDVQNWELN